MQSGIQKKHLLSGQSLRKLFAINPKGIFCGKINFSAKAENGCSSETIEIRFSELEGLIGLGTGFVRFFSCWIAKSVKGDRFSCHRKMVWKNVWIYFGATFLFFYLAFHI